MSDTPSNPGASHNDAASPDPSQGRPVFELSDGDVQRLGFSDEQVGALHVMLARYQGKTEGYVDGLLDHVRAVETDRDSLAEQLGQERERNLQLQLQLEVHGLTHFEATTDDQLRAENARLQAENKRLEDRVEYLSTDPVTGLEVRAVFEERLEEIVNGWIENLDNDSREDLRKNEVTLYFGDVGRFKEINDTHGHEIGDQILELIAAAYSRIFNRSDDAITRLGGDEFVAVANGVGPDHSQKFADQIITSVKAETQEAGYPEITIDVGRITLTRELLEAAEEAGIRLDKYVLALADQAMYKHKKARKVHEKAQWTQTRRPLRRRELLEPEDDADDAPSS